MVGGCDESCGFGRGTRENEIDVGRGRKDRTKMERRMKGRAGDVGAIGMSDDGGRGGMGVSTITQGGV